MFYEFKHFGTGNYFLKEYGENFSFPPHMHSCFEFITLLHGEMQITVDGEKYRLTSGESLLIFPNQLHAFSSTDSKHMLCIFSPDLVRAYYSKVEHLRPKNHGFSPQAYLTAALCTLSEDAKSIEKKGILYSLCADFDKTAQYIPRNVAQKGILSRVFSFVEEHYHEDCSLERLSGQIGYDYAYLSRYFKKATGISYGTYLNIYRLNKACYLLENTNQTVLQCAYDCGYNSLRTFNRNFKKQFSQSPAQYRGAGEVKLQKSLEKNREV